MMRPFETRLLLLLVGAALTACGDADAPAGAAPADAHDHSTLAARGGTIVELGDHAALLEVVHDAEAGVVTVHVMDMDGNALEADSAPVVNMKVDGAPKQVEGVGAAGTWTFTDDALKGHVHDARLRVGVNGKTFTAGLPDVH